MCVCINAIVQTEANTHLENVNIWGSESGIQEFFVLFFLLFYQPEVTSKLKLEDLMGINQPSTGTSFGGGGAQLWQFVSEGIMRYSDRKAEPLVRACGWPLCWAHLNTKD